MLDITIKRKTELLDIINEILNENDVTDEEEILLNGYIDILNWNTLTDDTYDVVYKTLEDFAGINDDESEDENELDNWTDDEMNDGYGAEDIAIMSSEEIISNSIDKLLK
jgi:hypothetical protein